MRISEPEYHSGRLSRNSSRACCSHCAAGVAIMLHSLSDGCLPASGAVAKMGMHRWVCYGPEPRSASLGLPFDCTFSSTLSLGHPAMCLLLTAQGSVMLLTAQGSLTLLPARVGLALLLFCSSSTKVWAATRQTSVVDNCGDAIGCSGWLRVMERLGPGG